MRQGIISLINNRQSGRRRGRGGQRPQGMGGNSGNSARDNRQRGNAAQLLEKYKNLARDAQLAGDRVQTEYYLQFADHYFRVLEDNRSRYEDQQQAQRRRRDEDEDEGDEEMVAESENDSDDDDAETPVRERRPRNRDRDRDRPQSRQRANGSDAEHGEAPGERIALSVLPPAIGAPDEGDDEAVEEKPRRRTRRPRASDDGDNAASA